MESDSHHPLDRRTFLKQLDDLCGGITGNDGFFTPDSVFWRVSREPALLLAGMRALLLQVAHPKIAQGVADHSRYREDPLGRGMRTFTAVYGIVFGNRDTAIDTALAVRSVHDRVHGRVLDPVPAGMDPDYDANDPELLLWVAATLIDSAVVAHEFFVGPLSEQEKEQHYRDAKRFGLFFGIPENDYPATWNDFRDWWRQMMNSDTLTVTDTAREIYRGLLTGTWFTRLLAPFNYALAAMLLPSRFVAAYGMRGNLWTRAVFYSIVGTARVMAWLAPRGLRGVPAARRREAQLRR